MTIEEMKKIKDGRGYSYKRLSQYTGVPIITLQKIFTGKTKNPRVATLNAIERVLLGKETTYKGKAYEYEEGGVLEEERAIYGNPDGVKYGNPRKKQGEFTLSDYYALPDEQRVELIDGVFYDMSSPKIVHQAISSIVSMAISEYIRKNKGKCKVFYAPVDVQLDCDDKTMVQPDVLVVCDRSKIKDFGIMGAPDFLVEILSESTRKKDMSTKLAKYLNAGVREYWMIDPEKKCLIMYNFMDDNFLPVVKPLKGKAPVAIYDGKLEIDLDEIADSITEYLDNLRQE